MYFCVPFCHHAVLLDRHSSPHFWIQGVARQKNTLSRESSASEMFRPRTSMSLSSPSEWLLSPLRPETSGTLRSNGSFILRSAAGRWPKAVTKSPLDVFAAGSGLEEMLQLKELCSGPAILPTVRPLPHSKQEPKQDPSAEGQEQVSDGSPLNQTDVSHAPAKKHSNHPRHRPRGPLLRANSDILTVNSDDTAGSEAGHGGYHRIETSPGLPRRPATSMAADYLSISDLTRQANRRFENALHGPRSKR